MGKKIPFSARMYWGWGNGEGGGFFLRKFEEKARAEKLYIYARRTT